MPETAEDRKRRERFEAEDDLRTLVQADEIRKDRKRKARAMKMARQQMASLKNVGKDDA